MAIQLESADLLTEESGRPILLEGGYENPFENNGWKLAARGMIVVVEKKATPIAKVQCDVHSSSMVGIRLVRNLK